jgi:hypothetical protein
MTSKRHPIRRTLPVVALVAALLAVVPVASASPYGEGAYRGAPAPRASGIKANPVGQPAETAVSRHQTFRGVYSAGLPAPINNGVNGPSAWVIAAVAAGAFGLALLAAYFLRELLPRRRTLRTS